MLKGALAASLLAMVAGGLTGCGDDPAACPPSVGQGEKCSTTLSCTESGGQACFCKNGAWDCNTPGPRDLSVPDLAMHDLRPAVD